MNGNHAWDGLAIDATTTFGVAGDIPVAGDWSGSGNTKIGVFRNGTWFLDLNGNRIWDGAAVDAMVSGFGSPGDLPLAGAFQ